MRRKAAIVLIVSLLSACGAIPETHERQPLKRSANALSPRPEARQCAAALSRSSARFTPLPDATYGAGCSTLGAVKLLSLRGDHADFGVTNLTAVSCPLAQGFAGWARYGVDRAARQILGSALVRIETMGSYSCRYVAGTDRLSAHSSAQAIDVAAFVLADGRRISVMGSWSAGTSAERQFLQVIHASACKRFGTVLGPGYNAAHRNHLHLELSDTAFCR